MSQVRAIHDDRDRHVDVGPEAPREFRETDVGSSIGIVWDGVVQLGRRAGAGDLDRFVCPEEDYLRIDELSEELELAVDERDHRRAAEIREELGRLLPSHEPGAVLAVVRGLLEELRREPDSELARIALFDLEGYELALERAARESRRVFITPF